jgi:hypothetical protein
VVLEGRAEGSELALAIGERESVEGLEATADSLQLGVNGVQKNYERR